MVLRCTRMRPCSSAAQECARAALLHKSGPVQLCCTRMRLCSSAARECAFAALPSVCQRPCKPGSVRGLSPLGRPFIWDAHCCAPQATNPRASAGSGLPLLPAAPLRLFGLAPGGVCNAAAVASGAVRSCRTISTLPPASASKGFHPERQTPGRRCLFCCTVPGVTPGGRYPPPSIRGARTFLGGFPPRPPEPLAPSHLANRAHKGQVARTRGRA